MDQELFTRKNVCPVETHQILAKIAKIINNNPNVSESEVVETLTKNSSTDEFESCETSKIVRAYYRLTPVVLDSDKIPTGAGKHWPIGERLAEPKFGDLTRRYEGEANLKLLVDHFHICHSGGGGIGCGSGPVFSKHLKEIKSEVAAITASVFLAEKSEEMGAPNTCSAIGRHFEACDAILLYDLNYLSTWNERNGPAVPQNNSADQFWLEDYGAAEMMLMLASTNSRVFAQATKNFEGADFASFCKGGLGTVGSLIAPCYAEYPVSVLEDLDMKVLVNDLFNNRSFVEYSRDIKHPISRVGLFCVFPAKFANPKSAKTDVLGQLGKNWIKDVLPNIEQGTNDYAEREDNREQGKNQDSETSTNKVVKEFLYSDCGFDRIKMLGLLVNPYMPRLIELRDDFRRTIKEWEERPKKNVKLDFLKDYQRGRRLYEECLDAVYPNM